MVGLIFLTMILLCMPVLVVILREDSPIMKRLKELISNRLTGADQEAERCLKRNLFSKKLLQW